MNRMGKASEIWKEIKPKVGEMLMAVNDIETQAEKAQEEAYQRGYETAKHKCNIQAEKDLREVGERHYQKGLSDAWKAARKIIRMQEVDLLNLFTECYSAVCTSLQVFLKYDASECIEKIRQYEQKQEEIQVGDEVKWNGDESDAMFVVTHISEDGYMSGINSEEMRYDRRNPENWTKTGRHFPELVAVLEKMRGEKDG